MKRKFIVGFLALSTALALLPLFAAFEAHVINVTAKIENALFVPVEEIHFGTVFPQEERDQLVDVSLSQSFLDEDRVDDVEYVIRQKPKCWNGDGQNPSFGRVTEDENGVFVCEDENFEMLPLLCPYLSKHEVTTDGIPGENDSDGINAFHGPIANWTPVDTLLYQVAGRLAKSDQDIQDQWNIDLRVPCFGSGCAQDWEDFVASNNPDADAAQYVQPVEDMSKLFGCDLWLEIGRISLPGIGCLEKADVMLVLDRSGSIGDAAITMKNAAKAFIDALSLDGVHAGLASFASTGSLDQALTNDATAIKNAIDALAIGGATDLESGITLATGELEGPNDQTPDANAPDVMVIITDGQPNVPNVAQGEADAAAAADAARVAGIEVFVVGVGSQVDPTYLTNEIADDASHYFDAADFDDLEDIFEDLVSCPA